MSISQILALGLLFILYSAFMFALGYAQKSRESLLETIDKAEKLIDKLK